MTLETIKFHILLSSLLESASRSMRSKFKSETHARITEKEARIVSRCARTNCALPDVIMWSEVFVHHETCTFRKKAGNEKK